MKLVKSLSMMAALVMASVALGGGIPPHPPNPIGEQATLRMRVVRCADGDTLIGASIAVSQQRDAAVLATYYGTTDAHGVITFVMDGFQPGDRAWVAVLPAGETGRDTNHHYCYRCGNPTPGVWELGQSATCNDEKSGEEIETIVCRYSH
jgi:hypothetical protein